MTHSAPKKTLDLYPIDYPFETLFFRITAADPKLILNPDFQRKYKWDKQGWARASKFIESCLMRIPLPSCYFAEDEQGRHLVIDGVQRLTTIVRFMRDEFALEGLSVFRELEGKKFSELGEHVQELESSTIRCIVLRKENSKSIIREIFSRLNQGAVSLSDQEVRHALFPGSFDGLLTELAQLKEIESFGRGPSSEVERDSREGEERVLRYFAFKDNMASYDGKLREFLDKFMETHASLEPAKIRQLETDFKTALKHCAIVFGEDMFVDTSKERRRQSTVYYDLLMQTLGSVGTSTIETKKDKIKKAFEKLCASDDFQRSLSGGLANKASILRRQEIWAKLLKRALA